MGDQPGGQAVSGDVVVGQQVEIFGWATHLVDMLNAAGAQTTNASAHCRSLLLQSTTSSSSSGLLILLTPSILQECGKTSLSAPILTGLPPTSYIVFSRL